ncbi:c(7)-type cytochrome triheme protein [Geothermobacter ehrlichii]|uniref:C(7)-type cytochrome triheme protein n=1 Tax=Geothermobacter ehrlichii TaxID=213224 RepID=A0A5D3WIS1_9BACT|nr:cytochrome c3 family protein [Geothermobacter ehrlichii]TYO97089.1 c(7)-type cytochrome triheme protein [Geothermobacter ehrlichii]
MKRILPIAILMLLIVPGPLSARWIKDKVVFQVEATGPVEFSHYNHLEAVGKNCPTCHNKIFNIVTKKNPDFTMADMEKGKACGACHNGDRAFSVKEDCSTCHPTRDIRFTNDTAPALFSHEIHTGMYGCSECHPDLFVPDQKKNPHFTMDQMGEGEACGACHDGDTAFSVSENCAACHPTADIKFETDAGPATFPHSVHTEMYGCDECHPGIFVPDRKKNPAFTMDQMGEGEACGACHDGDTAFSVDDNCDSCHEM